MIIICEPQCEGFEHAEVNAALVAAMKFAFPQEQVLFLAETAHLQLVSSQLDSKHVRIQYYEIEIPPKRLSDAKRLTAEFLLCKGVFDFARDNHTNKILFSSITSPTLISIKILLRLFEDIEGVAVLHRILSTITKGPSLMPSKAPFWFRFWLSFGNMKRLSYLALSPYIEERLSRQLPRITQHVKSIDLPYFFEIEKKPQRFERDIIRFGAFGVGSRYKSADIFFRISREVLSSHTRFAPKFVLVGFLDPEVSHKLKDDSVITPSFEAPFSRENFADLAKSVDYAIFPSYYQLAVSSALMDAFSYAKPIIALKQPLFEYYFKAMGDIGYLCESYEDMKDLILAILEEKPIQRYLTQQCNIFKGREQFSPMAVSPQFVKLWKS